MGRQINFYMDRKTEEEFQEFILGQGLIIVSEFVDNEMIVNDIFYKKYKIYIMRSKDIDNLNVRKLKDGRCHIDENVSCVIEYSNTIIEKEIKKIFCGRIYVIAVYFNENEEKVYKDEEFLKIYDKLVRWIKKNCPMTKFVQDGYNKKEYISNGIKEMVEKEGYKLYW